MYLFIGFIDIYLNVFDIDVLMKIFNRVFIF